MKKQVLVMTEDEGIRDRLVGLIRCMPEHITIRSADSYEQAYRVLLEHRIDTIVCGGKRDGSRHGQQSVYRFVASVRTIESYYFTPVILISNVEDPSNYCFRELHCYDVIEYPLHEERFFRSLRKALDFHGTASEENILYIQEENVLYPTRCSQIGYVQSCNHVMEVALKNGSMRMIRYCTIQQLLEEANVSYLLQCSRSTVINVDYIYCIDYTNRLVTMQNHKQLSIGTTYVKSLQQHFRRIRTR